MEGDSHHPGDSSGRGDRLMVAAMNDLTREPVAGAEPLILGIICIGCGCTENDACPGGCYWTAVDRQTGFGMCSTCVGVPIVDLAGRTLII